MKTPGERLKEIRKTLGLTQQEVAEKLGEKWYRIKDIENNKLKLTPEFAKKLYETLKISPNYIIFGEGSPFLDENQSIDTINLDDIILKLKNTYSKSNDKRLLKIIDSICDVFGEEK